jgi:adenylate kinase
VNLVLLGPPGVGRRTQGRRLAERFDVPWLPSGDILRGAVREGTALGQRAERYMRQGDLVEDSLIVPSEHLLQVRVWRVTPARR